MKVYMADFYITVYQDMNDLESLPLDTYFIRANSDEEAEEKATTLKPFLFQEFYEYITEKTILSDEPRTEDICVEIAPFDIDEEIQRTETLLQLATTQEEEE